MGFNDPPHSNDATEDNLEEFREVRDAIRFKMKNFFGTELAKKFLPTAITLDLKLPDVDGWTVLANLKRDPSTRHIPVHIISVEEKDTEANRRGAIGHLSKPVKRKEGKFGILRGRIKLKTKLRTSNWAKGLRSDQAVPMTERL